MYSPKVQMPGLGEASLNAIYHRLDSANTPFTAPVGFPDGTKTLPAMYFDDDTNDDVGFYRLANETIGMAVGGVATVRIQGGPNRFLIGTDADTITPLTTFHVQDPDAGINLIRTIAAEAFISTQNSGGGGGQQRGLVSGGLRWVDTSLIELMRMTNGSDAALSINSSTALAHLHVQQPAGSSLDIAKWRTNIGFNWLLEAGGNALLGVSDTGVTNGAKAKVHMGGGNSGLNNITATQAFGFSSTGTLSQFVSTHHSGVAGLNGFRFWTCDGTIASTFPTNGVIGLSVFNGRAIVGAQSPDAIFGVQGAVDPLADLNDPTDYQMYIHNPVDSNGQGVGIAFNVDATAGFVGASIIHERVNNGSYGSLNFYTQQSIATNPDPIKVMELTETGTMELANGTGINEFSTDGTMAGDSDDAVPTEKAVKAYVDSVALINQAFAYFLAV